MNEEKELQPKVDNSWRIKRLSLLVILIFLAGVSYLAFSVHYLYSDKVAEDAYWTSAVSPPDPNSEAQKAVDQFKATATEVKVGTYVETIKDLNIKGSSFRAVMLVWFNWEGDAELDMANHFRYYKGYMNKKEIVKERHEGGKNYQLVRCDVTISKDYWTTRFPLESHQLKLYLEPDYTAERVVLVADTAASDVNANLSISGYNLVRHATNISPMVYPSTHGDPSFTTPAVTTEHVTALEINRISWGLYFKCFVALFGTLGWAMIVLYLCTFHRMDPLSMLPAALFGTVTNIMVGANLLPDALQLGLLEFVNILGILCILLVAFSIISINRIRTKHEEKDFAHLYGQIAFWSILAIIIFGNLLLPISAYIF